MAMNVDYSSSEKQPQRATLADMSPDIDNHDVLYGVVLPNLRKEHNTLFSRKAEYTDDEARTIDMAGLVLECNHNDDIFPVGATIAYRVQDNPNGGPSSAEGVFKLNREADEAGATDQLSLVTQMQRNHLMSGYHRGFSLGHTAEKYHVDCDADGKVLASADPTKPAVTYVKYHREISTCNKGRRPGSVIKEYFPCARSLRRSMEDAIQSFTEIYNYERPPKNAFRGTREWDQYLARLLDAIRQRRRRVLAENNFTPILHARGFCAASNEPNGEKKFFSPADDLTLICPDDVYLTQVGASRINASSNDEKQQVSVNKNPNKTQT